MVDVPSPKTILPPMQTFNVTVLLIDDQLIIAEAVKQMLEDQPDIAFHYCSDPTQAIEMAERVQPTVILQDLVMPEIDGLLLVRYFRANAKTENIPLIVLSTKEEPKIKAEAFALGANDYMVKLPDKVELVARVRYHSSGYIRLLERNDAYEKLYESQRILNAELMEAAAYVRSLLPPPVETGPIKMNWLFIPSTQLGGDAFGYHWLDPKHLCIYLLDVCGHGVGAAVLSISVMNVLRSQTLPNTDFYDPSQVLKALNETFPMEKHNNMFFTMWYGVYDIENQKIAYSSGGHPPAILLHKSDAQQLEITELGSTNLVVGGMSDSIFKSNIVAVKPPGKLYVFSDGVYEITKADESVFTLDEFIQVLTNSSDEVNDLERILKFSRELNGPHPFADDFSIVEVSFT